VSGRESVRDELGAVILRGEGEGTGIGATGADDISAADGPGVGVGWSHAGVAARARTAILSTYSIRSGTSSTARLVAHDRIAPSGCRLFTFVNLGTARCGGVRIDESGGGGEEETPGALMDVRLEAGVTQTLKEESEEDVESSLLEASSDGSFNCGGTYACEE
jgi:hypothetical protein